MKTLEMLLERTILLSRWLLVPLYLALIAVLILFTVKAFQEVIHLFATISSVSEVALVLSVLSLIDISAVTKPSFPIWMSPRVRKNRSGLAKPMPPPSRSSWPSPLSPFLPFTCSRRL